MTTLDNYLIQKSGAGNIAISISLPVALRNHTTYFVYATSNFTSPHRELLGRRSTISIAPFAATCTGVSAGGYIMRLLHRFAERF